MSVRRTLAGLWEDLPFWFLWLAPFAMLDLAWNQLGEPLAPSLLAFALPAGAVAWMRTRLHPGRGWGAYAAISSALLLVVLLGWTGSVVPHPLLLRLFEAAAFVELAVLAAHAAFRGGRRVVLPLFGVGALYGLILENGGILLGFFSEPGYLVTLPGLPAPVATVVGWCVVFYPLWFCTRRLVPAGAPGRRALLLTALALAFDLQLDPLATAAGFWIWAPSLEPAVRGVPLINFNAWASAMLPFAWVVFRTEEGGAVPPGRLLRLLPAVLGAALLMVLLLTALTEPPFGWPSLDLFGRALGL